MSTALHETSSEAGTRKVDRLLAHYGESHQNSTNELIHFVAIPLIMLSLLGLVFWVHPYAAYVFLAGSMIYYATLGSPVLLACMVVWGAILLAMVHAMGQWVLPISGAVFVVAWIFQFIGHKIEGKKPSFFEDIQYLLIGPLFVLSGLLKKAGLRW